MKRAVPKPAPAPGPRLLLVSGLSGAGKTSGLKILEDLGWEVVDNLPLVLLDPLLGIDRPASAQPIRTLAVGVDCRAPDFDTSVLLRVAAELRRREHLKVELVFFDCENQALQDRFVATRRRHPLAADRPVIDGIVHERNVMASVLDAADLTIDTTGLPLPELRQFMAANFVLASDPGLHVSVTSFSYRRGLPREADLVFDVRFLRNPHYQPDLAAGTGRDEPVASFIAADPAWADFFTKFEGLLLTLLPHYKREGKRYLTIAIGCTGGRHRSVFTAEIIARRLVGEGNRVTIRHRDLDEV